MNDNSKSPTQPPKCTPLVANKEEISKAIHLFFSDVPPDTVIEIRVLEAGRHKTISGYFEPTPEGLELLVKAALKLGGEHYEGVQVSGVYVTLNPANRDLLARAPNKIKTFAKNTTGDSEIHSRRHFLLDFDPVRPPGVAVHIPPYFYSDTARKPTTIPREVDHTFYCERAAVPPGGGRPIHIIGHQFQTLGRRPQ